MRNADMQPWAPLKRRRHVNGNLTTIALGFTCILILFMFTHLQIHPQLAQIPQSTSVSRHNNLQEQLHPEIWASAPGALLQKQLYSLLDKGKLDDLEALCGRCLYRTLTHYTKVKFMGRMSIVITGDIPAMWIRDSAVQIATYMPRLQKHPALRTILEGAIRAQAYFILQDPWANAYNPEYKLPTKLPKSERILGRGGWVWNRNFELDSIAYFFNLLWNWYATDNLWAAEKLLQEPVIHDAVTLYLRVLKIEQDHAQSPYRYSELPNNGLGAAFKCTGIIYTGFRPSDDPVKHVFFDT